MGEFPFETASRRMDKAADFEKDARRIEKRVAVLAAHRDPIPHPGDGLTAGAAEQNPAASLVQFGAILIGHNRALAGIIVSSETDGRLREHAPLSTASLH